MTALSPAEHLEIEHACERQVRRFARFNDDQAHDALAALFTEDGVFARPTEPDVVIRGRVAILQFFKSRPARLTRHLMCNVVVEVEGPDRASARSTVVLYVGDDSTIPASISSTLVGGFADRLRKVEGDWLFEERLGSLAMKG